MKKIRDECQVNFADDESRNMRSHEGFVRAYTAQVAADIDSYLILDSHLSQQPHDKWEVEPALEKLNEVEDRLGKPMSLLADTSSFSENNVKRHCVVEGGMPYFSCKRERRNVSWYERFKSAPQCLENVEEDTAQHQLRIPESRVLNAKHKSKVECVLGIVKEVMKFRRFNLNRLNAQGERNLVLIVTFCSFKNSGIDLESLRTAVVSSRQHC